MDVLDSCGDGFIELKIATAVSGGGTVEPFGPAFDANEWRRRSLGDGRRLDGRRRRYVAT